jgi:hypothetical protein
MYATALHEVVFRDAASPDFDASLVLGDFACGGVVFRVEAFRPSASDAGVFAGGSAVL